MKLKELIDKLYYQSDNDGDIEVLLSKAWCDGSGNEQYVLSDDIEIVPGNVFKRTHKDGRVFEYSDEEYLVYVCNKPKTLEDAGLMESKVDVLFIL
jgi:hypothetical protein